MGSDDLFHKRRERNVNDLRRKRPTRNNPARRPQPRILIVCEDSKSSAFYLEELAKDLGLNAVAVEGKRCGSAPGSVLKFARELYANSVKDRNLYDRVYCVFDRDQHHCFDETVETIDALNPKNTFFAITTTPCFEFWLLLHFKFTSKTYSSTQNRSPCDIVNVDLNAEWVDYGKNNRDIYAHVKAKTVDAIANGKLLVTYNANSGSINPQTNMHELIEYFQSIER